MWLLKGGLGRNGLLSKINGRRSSRRGRDRLRFASHVEYLEDRRLMTIYPTTTASLNRLVPRLSARTSRSRPVCRRQTEFRQAPSCSKTALGSWVRLHFERRSFVFDEHSLVWRSPYQRGLHWLGGVFLRERFRRRLCVEHHQHDRRRQRGWVLRRRRPGNDIPNQHTGRRRIRRFGQYVLFGLE